MTGRGPYKPRRAVKKPKTLGERIVVLRQALRMNQAGLAEVLGVPQQSISAWERGITEPSGPAMALLTATFKTTEEALRTGEMFEIPEELMPTNRIIERRSLLMAVEGGTGKPIALPAASPGEVWGVDALTGERVRLSRDQALAWLAEAIDNQAPVWIVSKPDKKAKRIKVTTRTRKKA
ncbi:helix-turn-helix domain-containing protein [Geothrix paludis]|uniref:helix-turn-helix domain-containing protein n=1 Tax=Geothrix paludis TaxID=2922722 RepID=UPI00311A9B7E